MLLIVFMYGILLETKREDRYKLTKSKYDLSGLNPALINIFNGLEPYLDAAVLWSSDIYFEDNALDLTVSISTIVSAEETEAAASRLINFTEQLAATNGFDLECEEANVEEAEAEHFGESYKEYSTYVEFHFPSHE